MEQSQFIDFFLIVGWSSLVFRIKPKFEPVIGGSMKNIW